VSETDKKSERSAKGFARKPQMIAFGAASAIMMAMVLFYVFLYPGNIGVAQPIPFSHRVHAREKHISCFFCHTGAIDTARSGIPPLETCMLCHKHIAVEYPPIKDLRAHYYAGQPVVWGQNYWVPDFVYFDHSVHIQRAVDCRKCHGDVLNMDRILVNENVTMGFCSECHKQAEVTHDCFTCHR